MMQVKIQMRAGGVSVVKQAVAAACSWPGLSTGLPSVDGEATPTQDPLRRQHVLQSLNILCIKLQNVPSLLGHLLSGEGLGRAT